MSICLQERFSPIFFIIIVIDFIDQGKIDRMFVFVRCIKIIILFLNTRAVRRKERREKRVTVT